MKLRFETHLLGGSQKLFGIYLKLKPLNCERRVERVFTRHNVLNTFKCCKVILAKTEVTGKEIPKKYATAKIRKFAMWFE